MGGQVKVEIDGPSAIDLNLVMKEIRENYEALITKKRKELELWYQNKITVVEKEAEEHSTSLEASRLEIKELKSTLQTLQIEQQSHLSMKSSLEATLREVHERYSTKLVGLQSMVTGLQAQITLLTASINENNLKYGTLLDLKTRLEAEIVEYRRLLDGEDDSSKT
ncbi:hypothetical protein CHARACLAT_031852, partial [Characodon lateralis]|nr:hypothetical protein [Characodon lateralis]